MIKITENYQIGILEMDYVSKIQELEQGFGLAMAQASDLNKLEQVRQQYLGRSGLITEFVKIIKELSSEDKKSWGGEFNRLKIASEQSYQLRLQELQIAQKRQVELERASFDVTAYQVGRQFGSLHPCSLISAKIEDVFISMGYQIADGPEIETEFYNFEALNVAKDHPARDMQDTFWLNLPGYLLRTQTSNVQIHTMQNQQPPIAILAPGRVYRSESTDASHDFAFMQVEGLLVGRDISMANLLATMQVCLQAIFGQQRLEIRVRPGFFPFVEPGVEIDMECPFCKQGCSVCKRTRWIEICGAGLVHPNVLRAVGADPDEFSGFAFGLGLTRVVMLNYGINDIRLLHTNRVAFLQQF